MSSLGKKKYFVTLLFIFIYAYSLKAAFAVYYASDTVFLYENEQQTTDNTVIWQTSYGLTTLCENGVCEIGQQFYPVMIYKTNEPGLTKRDMGFEKSFSVATSPIEFNPGPSFGGEGCGIPNCIGGRIGNPREYKLDIVSGKYVNIGKIKRNQRIVLAVGGSVTFITLTAFGLKKIRKNLRNT